MPRFQFTIRGLLWATFWAAVGMAGRVTAFIIPSPPLSWWPFVGFAVMFVCPPLAVVSICGRTPLGLFLAVLSVVLTVAIMFGLVIMSAAIR